MRVEGWKGKQVFDSLIDAAMVGLNTVMDDHVADAKRRCPSREEIPIGTRYRPDRYAQLDVLFTTKRGKEVNFIANTWMGRISGSLKSTIRKVEKHDRPGNLRCYAGNSKVFYARFVEYGTASTGWGGPAKAQPYLRPSFQAIKGTLKDRIEAEMRKVPEVKT